jgi:hypothetical protein
MKTDFMFPVVGWHHGLSENAKREIQRRFPTLSLDRISNEAGYYRMMRDEVDLHPSPEGAREKLRIFRQQIRKLHATARSIARGPLDSVIRHAACVNNSPVDLETLQTALLYSEKIAATAITLIPKGRRRSARERLVRSLAAILQDAGESIDAKPKGTLCCLVDIVLRDVGEKPSDIPKLVRPITRRLENSPK